MSSSIEIERKFLLTAPIKQRLLSLSSLSSRGRELEKIQFRDQYFDQQLALRNVWLRTRNGQWELKIPLQSDAGNSNSRNASIFKEIAGYEQVSKALLEHRHDMTSYTDINDLLKSASSSSLCYAVLDTERTQFSIPWQSHSVNITLDECKCPDEDGNQFHVSVGELEILVSREEDINKATGVLDDLVNDLRVKQVEDKEGKLLKYLKEFKPSLYKNLCHLMQSQG